MIFTESPDSLQSVVIPSEWNKSKDLHMSKTASKYPVRRSFDSAYASLRMTELVDYSPLSSLFSRYSCRQKRLVRVKNAAFMPMKTPQYWSMTPA